MKKYRLTKEYPGSPKLGIIAYWGNHGLSGDCYQAKCDNIHRFDKNTIENNPEFWEEVVEKDYEILSFKTNNVNPFIITNSILKVKEIESFKNIDDYINSTIWDIHSILRKSDGEVFTVGDIIYTDDFKPTNLEKITIRANGSLAMWGKYHSDILGEVGLQTCLTKKPLYTTEDNVDIYEGDKCWGVIDSYPWKVYQVNTKHDLDWIHKLTFSTKEAAEEYILMNKPCLSLSDVNSSEGINRRGFRSLKKLVKSRL